MTPFEHGYHRTMKLALGLDLSREAAMASSVMGPGEAMRSGLVHSAPLAPALAGGIGASHLLRKAPMPIRGAGTLAGMAAGYLPTRPMADEKVRSMFKEKHPIADLLGADPVTYHEELDRWSDY